MRWRKSLLAYTFGLVLLGTISSQSQDRCAVSFNPKLPLKTQPSRIHTAEIKLPVAIHFHDLDDLDDENTCWKELAAGLVDRLNEDFNRENAELTPDWEFMIDDQLSVPAGNSMITFQLAQYNHPFGSTLVEGEKAVTYNLSPLIIEQTFEDYLNIHIGLYPSIGMSPIGGTGKDGGLYIDIRGTLDGYACTENQIDSSYNMARTLTHEMGHYLGLNHLWGEEDSCTSDDGIEDTPLMSDINYGCNDSFSCQSQDMTMNYMGYADDACMYMFTPLQCSAMRTYVLTHLQTLVNKGPSVFSTETCRAPTNLVVNDNQGTISIFWDELLGAETYLAVKSTNDSIWTETKVDTNVFQFENSIYPNAYELVMYNTCQNSNSIEQSQYTFHDFSLQRPKSFYLHDWFNLYPNPAQDFINIEIDLEEVGEFSNILNLTCWNVMGQREIYESYLLEPGSNSSKIALDINDLDNGTYYLRMQISYYVKEVVFVKS